MSLDKQKRNREAAEKQRQDFIKGELAANYGELGPDYPIPPGFTFRPDFFPGIYRVRHLKSAVGGQDKIKGLPEQES